MKKFVVLLMSFLTIMVFVGCNNTSSTTTDGSTSSTTGTVTTESSSTTEVSTTDTYPVINGAVDKTIEKNSTFVPLAGITAYDQEDGEITEIHYDGNVNPMKEGEYEATYTVFDSDGNITSVTITITVVYTDTQGPLLVGVGDVTIYVGEEFDPLEGVSANDTIDGAVEVTYTGELNIWAEGVYTLTYSASDESGNKTVKERKVTVDFGDFVFGDPTTYNLADLTLADDVYSTPVFSGGLINDTIADFTYVKVTLDVLAAQAGSLTVDLNSQRGSVTEIGASTSQEEFVVYYVINAALSDVTVDVDTNGVTLTDLVIDVQFAEVRDMVAPTLNVPSDEMAFVVNYPQTELEEVLMNRVTAVDDIDGNITSQISINYGALDLTTVGTYEVVYSVSDAGGNETTYTRRVVIGNLVDSGFITDPTFQNNGDNQWIEKSNNGEASITYDALEKTMTVTVTKLGDWLSAAGAYIKDDSNGLEADQWYMFTFTVKTTIDRKMGFRMGLATDEANGWIDDFDGRSDYRFDINSEYQTFNFFFKLDSIVSTAGYEEFMIELNLGNVDYSNIGKDGVTTFKDIYMYKIVTTFDPPTYVVNQGADLPVKFTVGDTAPTWEDYVTFYDMSQTVLTPTFDASAVDFNNPGKYNVVFEATDSRDMTTTYTLEIQVLSVENADTVGPVVTVKEGVPTSIDQFTNLGEIQIHQLVTAIDAVDGEIAVLPEMVDNGGLNFNVAGTYTITFTVYDLSGNITVFTVDVEVVDKEGPKINANGFSVNVGDTFDPFLNVTVVDNVDGTIDNANVTVTGLDQFLVDGVVTTEGTFTITYEATDALGNISTKSVEVLVSNLNWDESTRTDLLGNNDEGPTHSTVTYDATEEAYLITDIDTNVDPWDHARWVYYFANGVDIEMGKTYKFEIVVKADVATDLYFRVGSTLSVDPWIDNFTGGLRTISIGTEYNTYEVIFTVDKDMVDGTAKFQFMYGYLSTDSTNTIYVKEFDIVQEQQPVYEKVTDLLTPGEIHHSTATVDFEEEAYKITGINKYQYDWDPGRIVYYLNESLFESGQQYRIVFTVKADVATELRLRIGATLYVDPWIDNFTGGLKTIYITDEYVTYEMVFTVDKAMINGDAKFQFMYGYLDTDVNNTLYIKDFALEKLVEVHTVDEVKIDDFTYADEAAFEAEWTERTNSVNTNDSERIVLNPEDDSFTFLLPATANEGWTLARKYDSLATLGVTDEYLLLGFYVTNNTNVTTAGVWLYWSGSQNAYTVNLPAIGESGWVYLDVYNESGKLPSEITDFGIGFNNWSGSPITGSLVISYVTAVKNASEFDYIISEEPVVEDSYKLVDEFTYEDEAAFEAEWTERTNGANTADSPRLTLDALNNAMIFDLPTAANEGWTMFRKYETLTNLGATDNDKYLALYITNNTNVTSGGMWLYWSGNQNAYTLNLPAIGESGWVVIDVTTSGKTVAEIIDFAFGFNNWSSSPVTGNIAVYKVLLIDDPIKLLNMEVEVAEKPANEAPVINISDSNLAIINGLTLEAGQSLETLVPTLLGMIEINDAEDGVITATQGMLTLNGLNVTAPEMGSYSIDVNVSDSNGLAAATYTFKLQVVTIVEDFDSYTDDADFKANWPRINAFRVSNGSWGLTVATLSVIGDNNVLDFTYGAGTNGIKFNVTKTELVAAGAEYIGIYVKTSVELTGTSNIFQAFYYNAAGYKDITTFGTISFTDEGTYFFVKVADLAEDTTAISLMINLASGNSGTMTMDNIVIK
ncbi:MAG: DUF5011 domain-containing protein [Candidatus Izemoplasmatales bacterium]|nr:DUF5011 domain-containing protein [Candidatus Izemoplasmatales bacterium]